MLLRQGICLLFIIYVTFVGCYPGEEKHDIGTLAGDVQNWAMLIQNYILQLASDGIKRDLTQSYLDQANYTYEKKNVEEIVQTVKLTLGDYFSKKKRAAERLAEKVREIHDDFLRSNSSINAKVLKDIDERIYRDSDIPSRLPHDIIFNPYFRQGVSLKQSSIKLPDEVPRNDRDVINTVYFTARLEETFLKNAKDDPLLRWQYFGSTTGVMRLYPGREWSTNFAGFYNDYDARIRPWYIAATSGPKDVVIILDCSLSMKGEKFSIGKAVAKTVINTLTKQDYVNVICARASHWDEVGKWHFYNTESLSCVQTDLVPATNSHRKDLIEKIDKLRAGGTSELQKGFEQGLDLLQNPRTGCQSLIVFATDGIDTDGEDVRCGPGYYTRSGYVPGPICKYNYSDVWELVLNRNKDLTPPARIFSYLIVEDAELFPGNLSCRNNGSIKKLMTGENLISQMSNYFEFLSANAMSSEALWTSPYLDAWGLGLMITHAIPVLSGITGKYIGVVGIDATLDEIENFLTKHQWGSVDSFLINDQGETIFHPRLKPSKKLLDDPIFIPISRLEQDNNGNPSEFSTILRDMKAGKTGTIRIEKAKGGKPRNYYYAALNNSEYSFAFSLADTDMEFRRSQEPLDRSKYDESYYNLLKEYKGRLLKERFPGLWKKIDIRENERRYPGLRITYKHSTIFLAPKAHCDPTKYMYNDNLAMKTYEAHIWINGNQTDLGCESGKQKFNKGVRADVLITQPIEEIWRTRDFESINQIKWTNVGLRSGVFRTYPGHRSSRGYDPTKRPWYKRTSSAPHKTSISTPYMDAAGVGKINTISQAVFEGMTPKTDRECEVFKGRPLPGGCKCDLDSDCMTKVCYLSKAPGPNADHRRCSTERVEAVTGLDILYDDFQNKTMGSMQASDFRKSCQQVYTCRDGEPGCETRCYLFDSSAKLVMDPDFLLANNLDKSKYDGVTLGRKEGEVMKHLIYEHGFIKRNLDMDFQGSCRISPLAPKVTLEGIPKTPEESDDYYRDRGPIPKFHSDFGCIQDVVSFSTVDDKLGSSGMITGNVSGPCMSGFYYVTALPKTNLYLLVIEDWNHYRETLFYNFNCKITRSVVNSGAYRIINGTCAHEDDTTSTLAQRGKCPVLKNITMPCTYTAANQISVSHFLLITAILLAFVKF
ncbi:voltage-dependent calcium channel subunit alpha-2/delta-2 [Patella vulgata]|uniref:voltage-dependent calcium channel subunit alpha-2/delta-2 n=1 Tax=Patella vulgata TaxID=6465 RepID=UPI00217F321C|nr:voltage-dependent calcium channel subunit alpha-2/delta-2 [Patella vulgata]